LTNLIVVLDLHSVVSVMNSLEDEVKRRLDISWEPSMSYLKDLNRIFEECQLCQIGVEALTARLTFGAFPKKEWIEIHSACNSLFKTLRAWFSRLVPLPDSKDELYQSMAATSCLPIYGMNPKVKELRSHVESSWKKTIQGYQSALTKRKSF